MTWTVMPDPVVDPHCGRRSDDRISFTVDGHSWDIPWGSYDVFGTAAFWIDQTARGRYAERVAAQTSSTEIDLEIVFCLLGGFGVTAESATAAHQVLLNLLQTEPEPTAEEIEELLRQPLPDGHGRYRFPRQRAARIAAALERVRSDPPPRDPGEMRTYLLGLRGVGPKTAAWIVRNVTGSADVAIIDIWLVRAMTWVGVFKPEWRVERHYDLFEQAFLQYAEHGNVHPAALDLCIWEEARIVGPSYFS